jgi:hypothetical protein
MADATVELPLGPRTFASYYGLVALATQPIDMPVPASVANLTALEFIDWGLVELRLGADVSVYYRPTVQLAEDGGDPAEPRYVDTPAPADVANITALEILQNAMIDLPAPANVAALTALEVLDWYTTDATGSAQVATLGVWPDTDDDAGDADALITLGYWQDTGPEPTGDVSGVAVTLSQPRYTLVLAEERYKVVAG